MGIREFQAKQRAKAQANLDRLEIKRAEDRAKWEAQKAEWADEKQARKQAKVDAAEAHQGRLDESGVSAAVSRWPAKTVKLRRKELDALPALLAGDEQIELATLGFYDGNGGLVVLTDQRILYVCEGLGRRTSRDIQRSRISSVQWSPGLRLGTLLVDASGSRLELKHIPEHDGAALAASLRSTDGS